MSQHQNPSSSNEKGGESGGNLYVQANPMDEYNESQEIKRPSKSPGVWSKIRAAFATGPMRIVLWIGLILSGFGIVGGIAMLNAPKKTNAERQDGLVEHPPAPREKRPVGSPVTPKEAKRQAMQANDEAEDAYQRDESYQAQYSPFIQENEDDFLADGSGQFQVDVNRIHEERKRRQEREAQEREMKEARKQALYTQTKTTPLTSSGGEPDAQPKVNTSSTASSTASTSSTRATSRSGQGRSLEAQQQEARRQYEQELRQANMDRERYIKEIKQSTMKNLASLMERGQGPAFGPTGQYTYASYLPPESRTDKHDGGNVGGQGKRESIYQKPLIKAGESLYATLDAEANTDESKQIFATIHGGQFDGAKVFGKIEMGQENMTFTFTKLAPRDARPTMTINAVALREEDAKQGMASEVDHHTLSRYTALAASSLLSGYGRAYSRPTGETVIAGNGTVVTNNRQATAREANAMALGEVGEAMSQEIRRGFDRPPTMSTPASTGFALFFLDDLHE